ncbi:MAG: tRNA (N6-threonylcarbamoyladenosine(37)-N6)-methyltransferase TrmO [Promethearchaeota archaeon]
MKNSGSNHFNIQKFKALLSYWVIHNNQHTKEIEKWLLKIEQLNDNYIIKRIRKVIHLFKKINKEFESIKIKVGSIKDVPPKKELQGKEDLVSKSRELSNTFEFKQIGVIHTPYKEKAPFQPIKNAQGEFRIVIYPEYAKGLYKLDMFKYIYVIYYIHRVTRKFRNIITPSWTGGTEVGIFASRSPVRPNLIGISVVPIKNIVKNTIFTSGLDVFDETPLLDIKPYIKDLDSKSDSNYGWIENLDSYEHLLLHIKGIPHDY